MKINRAHTLFMSIYLLLLLLLVLVSCKREVVLTKDIASFPVAEYIQTPDSLPFHCDYSNQSSFSCVPVQREGYFCDFIYPAFKARLYCTYYPLTPDLFPQMADESRRMAYHHTTVANAIRERRFTHDEQRVYGVLYNIEGNVATPIQFSLTDSISFLFHASLYFDAVPKADSIASTLEYLRKDVERMMNSFTHLSIH